MKPIKFRDFKSNPLSPNNPRQSLRNKIISGRDPIPAITVLRVCLKELNAITKLKGPERRNAIRVQEKRNPDIHLVFSATVIMRDLLPAISRWLSDCIALPNEMLFNVVAQNVCAIQPTINEDNDGGDGNGAVRLVQFTNLSFDYLQAVKTELLCWKAYFKERKIQESHCSEAVTYLNGALCGLSDLEKRLNDLFWHSMSSQTIAESSGINIVDLVFIIESYTSAQPLKDIHLQRINAQTPLTYTNLIGHHLRSPLSHVVEEAAEEKET
jgi:hypothetical protein